jgi:hypothetical protein
MAKKATGKKKEGKAKGSVAAGGIAISQHPRARRQINLAKSYAGLAAFGIVGYAAWQDGFSFVDVATRSLMWGIAAYVVVWAMAVQVWRHLAVAEVKAAEREFRDRQKAQADQVAKLRNVLEENRMPTAGTGAFPS